MWGFLAYLAGEAGVPEELSSLLSGGVSYLGASRDVSLLPVVHVVEAFGPGTGLERYLSSRRRLLQSDGEEGGGGDKQGGGGGWGAMFSRGFSVVSSMIGGVANIAGGQVSRGGNMGVILSARDPTHMLGHWCVAPAMAWSRFAYVMGVGVGLDVASTLYQVSSAPI